MIEQISVTDLKALMDAGHTRVIDVREKWEYDNGHLPGAVWIPMSLVPLRRDEFAGGTPAYIVCRTGNRSGQVVMWLGGQGISAVNVAGGTEAWQRQGYPVDTFATEGTH